MKCVDRSRRGARFSNLSIRSLLIHGLLVLFTVSCDSGSDITPLPTAPEVSIVPTNPDSLDTLTAVHDPIQSGTPDTTSEDNIQLSYLWLVNGAAPIETTVPVLERDQFARGDSVGVEILITDGVRGNTSSASPVFIQNTPPEFDAIDFNLTTPRVGDELQVLLSNVRDVDGDEVEVSYRWKLNGVALPDETSATLQAESSDFISAQAIITDGEITIESEEIHVFVDEPLFIPVRVIDQPISMVDEDRTRPEQGAIISSANLPLLSNGADLFSDVGPQRVDADRVASWPGLRYGDFLVSNNPWYASSASYPLWYQEISLFEGNKGYGVNFEWDWGAFSDTTGSIYNTKSLPEVIYGTKSKAERSGNFQATGLPVEIYDAPEISIEYSFDYQASASQSTSSGESGSEFNVVIESFYHSSCDIERTGAATDNIVFEVMVWLKAGQIKPSGDAPRGQVVTSDGRVYEVYAKSSNRNYLAFVAIEEQKTGSVQYSELLNHAQDNAQNYGTYALQDTDCLANIILGTEIWYGAGSFDLNHYKITRTY